MTRLQLCIHSTLIASLTILIAIIVSITIPALDVNAMSTGNRSENNINLPGLTEDRYAGAGLDIITVITDQIIPAMLPPTSGQGVCGIDITCDNSGNAVNIP